MSITILGISCYYHDSAACLLRDGVVLAAAQEERFTRIKNDKSFPVNAVDYCLRSAGIAGKDLDYVTYYEKPFEAFDRVLMTFLSIAPEGLNNWMRSAPSWIKQKLRLSHILAQTIGYEREILYTEHHESHAASAYYPSPFASAAVLTLDGVGEWATTTCAVGDNNRLEALKQIEFPHSLGLLYSAFTAYAGFKVNSGEYKLMGLAPYGKPCYRHTILDNLIQVYEDGSFSLNMDYFSFLHGRSMTNDKFHNLFGGPPREQESQLDRRIADLAASIQAVTEEISMSLVMHLHKETGQKKLCMAGGVALNCVSNSKLLRNGPFEDIWIQPAAGDAGGALGAALATWHRMLGKPRVPVKRSSYYLGPSFSVDEVQSFLDGNGYKYTVLSEDKRAKTIANLIADGKIVGHMAGRMEYGPRALGNRSILGNPCGIETQHVINQKIKYRESFRPFAPSVLEESIEDFFDMDRSNPYMLFTAPIREDKRIPQNWDRRQDIFDQLDYSRSSVPAITHVDYSARLQSVRREDNPRYHEIIQAFEAKSGVPLIVNTSFNVRGEPIILSPEDAYSCFMNTEMDALVIENTLLMKSDQAALAIDHNLTPKPILDLQVVARKSRLPVAVTLALIIVMLIIGSPIGVVIFCAFFILNLGCLLSPRQFKLAFRLLHKFIATIQRWVSKGILLLLYFTVISPTAWIWRLRGTALNNVGGAKTSTWIKRNGFQSSERYTKKF